MSRTSRNSALTAGLLSWHPTSHNYIRNSFGTPCPATARGRGGTPRGQFVQRLADLGRAGRELFPAERTQANPVVRVDLAMPLLHPRLQLGQASDEGNEPVIIPAILLPIPDDQRQGQRLLSMIPPSPAQQRRRISLPARVRIQDEPLLRHIQL